MADGKIVIDAILDDGTVTKGVANIDKSLGGLGGSGERTSLSIGKIASALGLVYIAKKGIDLVKGSLDGAITRFDTLNQFPRVMQMIGFDADESEAAINRLSDGVQGLPTRLDAVASTAQNIAVMTGDLDGAVDTTLALNNAFLASGASTADAERGLQQYVQMLSKGEVDLQSWRTLQETMGVALTQLANDFGFTGDAAQNDLYDALKSGEITFDEFNAKLIEASERQGGFAEMALIASEGVRTSWENIKTAFVNGVNGILEEIDKLLGGTGDVEDDLTGIVGVLEGFKDGVYTVFGAITDAIPAVAERIKTIYNALEPWIPLILSITAIVATFMTTLALFNSVAAFITPVITALKSLRTVMMTVNAAFLANPVGIVVAGLAAIGVAVYLLIKNFDKIKEKVLSVFPAMEPVFDLFSQAFERAQDGISRAVDALKIAWEGLKPIVTVLAQLIGGVLVVALGVVISVFNGVMNAVGPVISVFANLLSFLTNMVAAIVKLFTGDLQGAWDHLGNAGHAILNVITDSFEAVITFFAGFIETIVEFFHGLYMTLVGNSIIPDMVNEIVDWFVDLWDWLVEIVSGLVDGVVEYFTNLYDKASEIFQAFWDFIVDVWDYIKETFQNALDFILALVTGDFEGIKTAMQNQMENAQKLLSNIWDTIKSLIGKKATEILTNIIARFIEIKNNIQNKITEAKDALVKRFTEMVSSAKSKAQEILTNIISKFNEIKTNITNKLTEAKNNLVNKFTEMKTSAVRKGQEIVSAAKEKFEAVKNGIRDKLTEAVSVVGQKIGEMPGKVLSFVGQMVTVGKGLIGGLINGIKNMGKQAIEAVTGVVDGVISKAKSLLDINSPSKLFEQFGAWISEGLAHGIDKMKGLAERASAGLAGGIESSFNPELTVGGIGGLGSLKGLTADSIIGNLSGSNLVSHETVTVTNSNNNIASILNEQNQLLGKILNKDQDVYIDSEKITDKVNENNAIIASLNKF